jgi:membrane associated rhomboid family serine protease
LGAYFLLFPANKIQIIVPLFLFLSFAVSAWVLLGCWFVWQILVPQNGVANWAHVGGFLSGMVTVLIIGGPSAILKGRNSKAEVA